MLAWVGLKNGDDQGTNFDLRAQVYVIDVLWTVEVWPRRAKRLGPVGFA